ncbi:MAG: zinc ribbon domain-containing protein [Steroidobacteraceae bacterium]
MPFYEYQCSSCGHHREELQKVGDRALRKCPDCKRNTLKRLVSAPVFRLKGGGWYETDFKGDKDEKRNLAGDREPVAADSTEVKPAPAAADAANKPAEPAKVAPATTDKPKTVGGKTPPARKTTTRRRVRK